MKPALLTLFLLALPRLAAAQAYTVTDLGTLPGGTYSEAHGINSKGHVTGVADTDHTEPVPYSHRVASGRGRSVYVVRSDHAFLWDGGRMHDLGTLPGDKQSSANAINVRGAVVGASGGRGCLWRGGKPFDLNALVSPASGWMLQGAAGINDRGQIVGNGRHNGKPRGFLLTPKL